MSLKNLYVYALFLHFCSLSCCFARNTITFGNPINSSGGPQPHIVSSAGKFALGFFTPNGTPHPERLFVGIWFHGVEPRTVVWVANRDRPVSNSTIWVFGIGNDGNLMLSDRSGRSKMIRLTNLGNSALSSRMVKLMDSGNLVLSEDGGNGSESRVVWESFLQPTDTFLPGMKITENLTLTSWKSQDDPAPGVFSFRQDGEREKQYMITKNEVPYWKSGLSGKFITNNDEIPLFISLLLLNISQTGIDELCSKIHFKILINSNNTTAQKYCNHTLPQDSSNNKTRLVMGFDGKLRFFKYNETNEWSLNWFEPKDRCRVLDACGKFGTCNKENKVPCKCLPGFKPLSPDNWNNGDFAEGCTRTSPVCSQHDRFGDFLKLSMMKVQKPVSVFPVDDEGECQRRCHEKCNCEAYSYSHFETYLRGRPSNFSCGIWLNDLNNIQESYAEGGLDLYLHVPHSQTGSRKTCGCGTNVIPYPLSLSTGPSCGDPMYLSFNCQNETDTGQISFNASGGGAYRVTSINPETQRFSIQVNNSECRSSRNAMEKLLQLPAGSSPFFVSSACNPPQNNFSIDSSSEEKWFYEVEIGWKPPPEPICNSSKDCTDWPNSSCKVASDGTHRCLCNKYYQWNSSNVMCALDIDRFMDRRRGPFEGQKPIFYVFIGVTASMLFILCTACALYQNWRRRIVRRQGGNLKLSDKTGELWSTSLGLKRLDLVAKLNDTGNLILLDDRLREHLWESFGQPTDTFLFGMKMDDKFALTSWTGEEDPEVGNFTFMQDPERRNQFVVMEKSFPHWKSSNPDSEELQDIHDDQDDGYDLHVRVSKSDIESTDRNCKICGINLVPYPLSTGPNCGDPTYSSFYCNNTDQLSFMVSSGNYDVIMVDPEARTFLIRMPSENVDSCNAIQSSASKILELNQSSPFTVTSGCSIDPGDFTNDSSLNGTVEVKISWKPPTEPTCVSSADCKDWPNSTCNNTGNGQKRCLCNTNFHWDGLVSLNCTPGSQSAESSNRNKSLPLILGVLMAIAMVVFGVVFSIFVWRRKGVQKRENQRKAALHRYDTERSVKELIGTLSTTASTSSKAEPPSSEIVSTVQEGR
ncbi:S-locus glycoprotein [Corchorus capsularis]|uniref:S-locus glycoprotein n=1 Tax=Corchorus capsularis TaxID=210143 RepID=A0A1R3IQK9_COCAP|nr:S-locus glycoprotein [Corchorus capsularis]